MISRRSLLVTGGAGVGLALAWAVWPRDYAVDLAPAAGETQFGAWLKIAENGQITVAVPQAEHGQGVWTVLPQILADELGADWRTIGVEAALPSPLYANPLAADALFGTGRVPEAVRREHWVRSALVLTGGSTSVRMFEQPLREAGAAARVLLCRAAAARWSIEWDACETRDGFVVAGNRRLRFGELAAAAARETLPDDLPLRIGDAGRLTGQPLPRLDAPAKVDGSANFAADVRLPDMVFASICQGPAGGESRLVRVDRAAADRVSGVIAVLENTRWVAAAANNWWAANRAIAALAPRFTTRGALADDAAIARALDAALRGEGRRLAAIGDVAEVLQGDVVRADYAIGVGVHAAIETPTATAWWHADRLELWVATQAPGAARAAAARAIGVSESAVTIHPMLIGGSFGQALEHDAITQAAMLAVTLKRPVQLTWSRREAILHDRFGAPAKARMAARMASDGRILEWQAKIATPATGAALAARLAPGDPLLRADALLPERADGYAMSGAVPPYRLPALAIDHHVADLPIAVGHLRGHADRANAFFTECFLDELAHRAGAEPMSYRIGMLGHDARLARCLTTAASLGGWDGGRPGSGQGLACHAMAGSSIAILAEAQFDGAGRPRVDRIVAAVDAGRVINPDVVRQQIEGGIVLGLALATGAGPGFTGGVARAQRIGDLALPRLADTPEITVELLPSDADPGGISDLGVAAVAPAIANALSAATGNRLRTLPFGAS
ncbi:xanthine dehydrogenase family protein molybdopterin-binding subunit [Sphingomonas sp. NBWT7]|uniref:molybdopterin cofactor-binding domain-containing protein n=1 Tax=Sphingomonas sp. NBWT7 TaxID=2596913 RepID=UPI001624F48A|nr:molybdopterin cofactor-binding domain-containing protein [Sphingomonas sp. NBWT7]QNE32661.1 xanthine dehydrogenase family protein molybdopterin-binding subunit [Sphingomonas sp. NBWT7]